MRLVILVYHLSTFNKKKEGLCGCTTAVFVLRRKKLGCQKTLQNFRKICLFSLQNFAFWMQNLRLFFAKNRGDRLLLNLPLLYRIVLTAGGLLAVAACPRGVRLQTHVSLITGDMFVALFSLVVKARVTFEGNSNSIACITDMLSYVYLTYIMPFVCSAGFLVLVIECAIFRQKVQTAASPLFLTLAQFNVS